MDPNDYVDEGDYFPIDDQHDGGCIPSEDEDEGCSGDGDGE